MVREIACCMHFMVKRVVQLDGVAFSGVKAFELRAQSRRICE